MIVAFASSINVFISSLFMFHREKTSSIHLFQVSGFEWLPLMISVSTAAMKIGKRDCHFCTHYGTVCLKIIFSVKMERVFF